ncbi:MAG: glycoside hydrolase family 3 C-terminal domain-containing protein [Bacteroidales bacterium]|nr:glycoside hydrolase family 3 C-terminal domain-containing protein [Bacteroidales bacterium]
MKIINLKNLLILAVLFVFSQCKETNKLLPYQDPDLSIEERVNDLVSRMTLDEKISQMMNGADSIARLGIPDYNWWSEGLHGVANSGIATVFPQAIGLGATWNDSLIYRVADVISTEFRAKFNDYQRQGDHGLFKGLTVWSPNINIFRDPRWGRGQETYGEDPFLTARIGVAFVRGLQGSDAKYFKVIATPKHYAVHSGPEPERHHFNAVTDYRDFAETYLPAFKACIVEGGAYSIMGAYQRYLGTPCCASDLLLKEVLRDKWNFGGYVVSDCGAIYDIYANHKFVKTPEEAAALAVLAGCDLECGDTYQYLKSAVEKGLLKESDIDIAVKRLFTARFKLGLFDPADRVSYAQIPLSDNDSPEHRKLALKTAHESMVLLKNEDNFLPLKKEIKTIAVIGANANVPEVLYGNYNGISSSPVTPLAGIKNRAPKSTEILFEAGSDLADDFPVLLEVPEDALSSGDEKGLKAEYFDNMELKGTPFLTRTDKNIHFDFISNAPLPGKSTRFSVRWSGNLSVPETGTYFLGFRGDDGYRVFLDNRLLFESWKDQAPTTTKVKVELVKGTKYRLNIEYYQNLGGAVAKFQWSKEDKDYINRIVNVAKQADVVVYVGGISPWLEGEEMPVELEGFQGGDRTSLNLPAVQEKVLRAIKAAGKPIVLVLLNGSALAVNWADENVNAILEAWYPGEEGGNAIADVLFGFYNPAGRLPVTFYKSVDDLPPFEDYNMKERTYRYFNGTPLYAFGYGLSYSTFTYSNLVVPESAKTSESVMVHVDVQNTGKMDGDEVVELYIKLLDARVPVPKYALKGFKRVHLKAGEKKTIAFTLQPEHLSLIDDNNKRVAEPGKIRLYIGGCQPGPKALTSGEVLTADFETTGKVHLIE